MGDKVIIRGIKLRVTTNEGDFGFSFEFSRKLTIVRANNSSGKSTLFNSLLYCLGMEELAGGKGEKILPYALKEHLEYDGRRVLVTASEVLLEIENKSNDIVTLRRSIRDELRDSKLIEIFPVAHLTKGTTLIGATPTYVHDSGSARRPEGFHHFLEKFLHLNVPQVPTTSGSETKLYLQAVFAALAVEQKRGWTDYIANIPFYGIRDARTKVVEFLLNLDVFETNATRNRLNKESTDISSEWRNIFEDLKREANSIGVAIEGISPNPSPLFNEASVSLNKITEGAPLTLQEHITNLRYEYEHLQNLSESYNKSPEPSSTQTINSLINELQELSVLHERAIAFGAEQQTAIQDYERLLSEANEDLERNRTAAKLRDLGARYDIATASGKCPTCNQDTEDTLLAGSVNGPQMDLANNVAYLEAQRRMLVRQIEGLKTGLQTNKARINELASQIYNKRALLKSIRGDVITNFSESRAIVRRQVQIEVEVEALERIQSKSNLFLNQLNQISKRMGENQAARRNLPKKIYSEDDLAKIKHFQMNFRANAGSFGYESAPISEIEISNDTLVPFLAHMELRAIRADIKSDSSASDFVRLIWSYLLALHQTSISSSPPGNHPGLLMFDEPGQHSMAVDSQHALLKHLASDSSLQSIVAASFDDSEEMFQQATQDIQYKLIQWDGKLIRPL